MASLRHASALLLLVGLFCYLEVILAWCPTSASGVPVLDLQPYWTLDTAASSLKALGTAGVKDYLFMEQTTDMLFPATYAAMLWVALDAAGAPSPALFFPVVAACADWAENVSIMWLCHDFLAKRHVVAVPLFVALAGRVFTPLKWTCFLLSLGALFYYIAAGCCCKQKGGAHPRSD